MTISQVSAKIDLRLNKSASGDYDNIWSYSKQEAFYKATLEWVRRQVRGKNATQEGDEESLARIDDLQILLVRDSLRLKKKKEFYETESLPSDYLYFKRITPYCSKNTCSNVSITSYLSEEANVDLMRGVPSFEFEETFHVISGNKIRIYFSDFDIDKVEFVYFRKPIFYNFKQLDKVVEFKDDICELLIDEACKILASDIESVNQKNLTQERVETNN